MGVQQTPLFEGERIEPKLRFTRVRHRNNSSASVLTSSVFSGILGTLTGSMRVNCQVLFVIAALTCAIAQQPPADDFILEKNVAIPMRDGVLLRADTLLWGLLCHMPLDTLRYKRIVKVFGFVLLALLPQFAHP